MDVRWRAGGKVVLLRAQPSGRRAMPLCPMAQKGGNTPEPGQVLRILWNIFQRSSPHVGYIISELNDALDFLRWRLIHRFGALEL